MSNTQFYVRVGTCILKNVHELEETLDQIRSYGDISEQRSFHDLETATSDLRYVAECLISGDPTSIEQGPTQNQ